VREEKGGKWVAEGMLNFSVMSQEAEIHSQAKWCLHVAIGG